MRIARVIGTVTMSRRLPELKPGKWVLLETLDGHALAGLEEGRRREKPMPESLVAYDELGVGVGELVTVSEGREATMPFYPDRVPIDAYCAAILDRVEWRDS